MSICVLKLYSLKEHTNHIEFLKPSIKKENVYEKSSIIVFLLTYGLFYVSSVLFPIDRTWYDALEKPFWTPPGMTIGMIWAVLFGLIALSVAIIYNNYGFKPKTFWFYSF